MNSPIVFTTILLAIFSLNLPSSSIADKYHTFSKTLSPENLGLKKEKHTHLHFYFHDIVSGKNKTVSQVAGKILSANSTNFGVVVVLDDPLTVGPELTSKQVGRAQGILASASQTEVGLLMVLYYVFKEGKYNGSTLSILGCNRILNEVREMPIVGGSGVFRFARGYAEARTYTFNTTSLDATVEYNVYVTHY